MALLGARRDVLSLIAAAGAVCLPSEAEALPMSVLEAMALARPVVATDVGGTRDQVVDGETGYLVPAGDGAAITRALLALATDREQAERMGAAGRERQRERFGGERMVDGYERAFEEGGRAWAGLTAHSARRRMPAVVRGDEEARHGAA